MPLREDLLQPIPGSNPAGANLRYDPLYDKIKETRREEEDVEQGDWKRARKVADWPQVCKLAGDVLATKSKDLQIAAWLTEAQLKQEGLGGLRAGLGLLRGLLEKFWESLYPGLEDGDTELRAGPLNWVGRYLEAGVRTVALNKAGHDVPKYKESGTVGYEADAKRDEKKQAARNAAISEKKLTAEEFDKAFEATPKGFYKQLVTDLDGCAKAIQELDAFGQQKFGDAAPGYGPLSQALEEVQDAARPLLAKRLQTDADPTIMSTANGRGWLDLQRYELTAAEMLGPEYQYVRGAIRGSLVGLLRDFPTLPDLTLMDDTATANVETRTWLQNGGLIAAA